MSFEEVRSKKKISPASRGRVHRPRRDFRPRDINPHTHARARGTTSFPLVMDDRSDEAEAMRDFVAMELRHGPGVFWIDGHEGRYMQIDAVQPADLREHVRALIEADSGKHMIVLSKGETEGAIFLRNREEALDAV